MPAEDTTPAGLYVHVPFCESVCPYCDFAVLIAGSERRRSYLTALRSEASRCAELGLEFDTVYLGGGTPSSLAPDQLEELLSSLRGRLAIDRDARLYLEANPEDVTAEAVVRWRTLGIGTVSLGVQSFEDDSLRLLGRRHTGRDALRAFDLIGEGGFRTVSIDLMFGIDGQTPSAWRRQLDRAVTLAPDHISCYQLTIHDGTVFGKRRSQGVLRELAEPRQAELFLLTHHVLADAGYEGYEISNFAAGADHRSRHNQKYWDHSPYLGLGPSAHSFDGRRRWWNRRKLRLWQRSLDGGGSPVQGSETLSDDQLALEAVMLGLRTSDGLDLDRLRDRYGADLAADNRDAIERWQATGHLFQEGDTLRPTAIGMAITDTIVRSLEVRASRTPAPAQPYTGAGSHA
jgi:oxygen-independent coproporphyrinogen-3 oxidase